MTVDLESRKKSELAELLHRYTSEDLPNFDGQPVADVNQVGVFGDTPLHIAGIRGSLNDVHVLVENGAVINCNDDAHVIMRDAFIIRRCVNDDSNLTHRAQADGRCKAFFSSRP